MILYHITNKRNLKSIQKLGVDPSYARKGKIKYSWFVRHYSPVLIAKIANAHRWSIKNMIVIRFEILTDIYIRHPLDCVPFGYAYKTGRVVPFALSSGVIN
jgi:hypothetical protein